jgi:XTP/dITP diphosphohydrolase
VPGKYADTAVARAAVVVVRTGSAVPPGMLTAAAWDVLRSRTVCCALADHPQREALEQAGVEVSVLGGLDGSPTPVPSAEDVLAHAPLAWLAEPPRYGRGGADAELVEALLARPDVVDVVGSLDPPGARLLDAVDVMDRLRSPGGCPWDAEQTFDSLKRYMLEEAYEAYETVEQDDLAALRDELGDVLLQVLFNARVAAEGGEPGTGWDIDDVAAGLVAKLVRRHPHVFAEHPHALAGGLVEVSGAAEVQSNWDEIKKQERAEAAGAASSRASSPAAGVPMGMPSLALAAKLQSRAAKAGFGAELGSPALASAETPAAAVAALASDLLDDDTPPLVDRIGELLFAVVALARLVDVDAETALRGTARRFRDRLDEAAEAAVEPGAGAEVPPVSAVAASAEPDDEADARS